MTVSSIAAFFIRPFYKMMLKKQVNLDDMQSVVSGSQSPSSSLGWKQ